MNEIIAVLNTPVGGAVIAIILSAVVRGMPEPTATAGLWYVWAYRSLHALLSNYDKLKAPAPPKE